MKTCFPALPIRDSIFCVGTCSSLLFLLLFLPYSLLRLLFLSSALESDSMSSTPNLEPIRQALGPYVKLRDLCTVYVEPRSLASDSINWQGLCVARRAPTLYQAWKRHARRLVRNGPKINICKIKCQNLRQKICQTKFARANVKIREHIT